jgi:hypothetical protein
LLSTFGDTRGLPREIVRKMYASAHAMQMFEAKATSGGGSNNSVTFSNDNTKLFCDGARCILECRLALEVISAMDDQQQQSPKTSYLQYLSTALSQRLQLSFLEYHAGRSLQVPVLLRLATRLGRFLLRYR